MTILISEEEDVWLHLSPGENELGQLWRFHGEGCSFPWLWRECRDCHLSWTNWSLHAKKKELPKDISQRKHLLSNSFPLTEPLVIKYIWVGLHKSSYRSQHFLLWITCYLKRYIVESWLSQLHKFWLRPGKETLRAKNFFQMTLGQAWINDWGWKRENCSCSLNFP